MQPDCKESDWKVFRQVRTSALERFCQRVLEEIGQIIADTKKGSHERYTSIYRLLQARDKRLAGSFDNPRRSMALIHLARNRADGLLTDEEFARFSDDARGWVDGLLNSWRTGK